MLGTAEGDELQELETSHRVRMRRRLEDTRVDDDLPTKSCFPPPIAYILSGWQRSPSFLSSWAGGVLHLPWGSGPGRTQSLNLGLSLFSS